MIGKRDNLLFCSFKEESGGQDYRVFEEIFRRLGDTRISRTGMNLEGVVGTAAKERKERKEKKFWLCVLCVLLRPTPSVAAAAALIASVVYDFLVRFQRGFRMNEQKLPLTTSGS